METAAFQSGYCFCCSPFPGWNFPLLFMVKPPTHINILQPFVGLSSPAGLRGGLTPGLLGNTEKVIAMVTVTVTPLSVQETYTRLNLAQKVYMWKTKKRRREVLQLSRYMMQHLSCNFNSSVSR